MLLDHLFGNRKRAVSPIIASILMIALSLAAASVVVVVLNNIETRSDVIDTSDTAIGNQRTTLTQPTMNITKLSPHPALQSQGIDDYVQITISVTNTANTDLYLFDFDIIVYGVKLDEISPWQISAGDVSGAIRTTQDGSFSGYLQGPNSVASYVVKVDDINNANARIPDETNFIYEAHYGNQKGLITNSIQQEKIAEIIFNPIFYNVAILHHASGFLSDDAARQYEATMSDINGTGKLFWLYERVNDAYDYVNNPSSINGTLMSQQYDLVIVDSWAVPGAISSEIMKMHQNGTNLVFYGSINDLGADLASIQASIDYTVTENITGLIPNMYDPNLYPQTGNGQPGTDNRYQFASGSDPVLSGLSGRTFEESECCPNVGDTVGYDAANLTSSGNYSVFGTAYYDYFKGTSPSYWTHTGPLMIFKDSQNNTGKVFSFVWKHNEDLSPGQSAPVTSQSQLTTVRKNMLSSIFSETERTTVQTADLNIDNLAITDITSNGNNADKEFIAVITATVETGNIPGGTLEFELDMPNELDFGSQTGNPMIYVDLDNDGSFELTNLTIEITSGNIITIDIGSNYAFEIPEGNVIKVNIPGDGKKLKMDTANTSEFTWVVNARYGIVGFSSQSFQRSVDSSVDSTPPAQVTGLTANAVSSSQIDLSWDANSEGDLDHYLVYRNSSQIANIPAGTTVFNDTGLSGSTTYSYQVSAVDTSGNEGVKSDPATATTVEGTPPGKVTGLSANAVSSSQIDLSWDASSASDLDHYNIYRNGSFHVSVTAGTTTYNDTSLLADTTYEYQVSAVDINDNEGQLSDIASATTDSSGDTTPPSGVGTLTATTVSTTQIDLSWSAATDDVAVDHYEIIRNGTFLDSVPVGTTSYSDTTGSPGRTYEYDVYAVDTSSNSGPSSTASTTTFNEMDVSNIVLTHDGSGRGNQNQEDFTVVVTILDQDGNPVQGITVTVTITPPQGASDTLTGVTDANGNATILFDDVSNRNGDYTASVDNVEDSSPYFYNPALYSASTTDTTTV